MRVKTILEISLHVIMWSLAIIAVFLVAVSDTWLELVQAILLFHHAMLLIIFYSIKNNLIKKE